MHDHTNIVFILNRTEEYSYVSYLDGMSLNARNAKCLIKRDQNNSACMTNREKLNLIIYDIMM